MRAFIGVAALAGSVAAANQEPQRPLTKVINLLKELQTKIETQEADEQNTYNKFACWCETTTQRKAGEIKTNKEQIAKFGNEILTQKGAAAVAAGEIARLTREIAENVEAQKAATSIRGRENDNFTNEKADSEQTLNALERAIGVLSGAGRGGQSFLSVEAKAKISAAMSTSAMLKTHQVAMVQQFLSSEQKYNPQSATIIGILKDMYDTFATTLQTLTDDELTNQGNYEELMTLKQAEKQADEKEKARQENLKAEAEAALAAAQTAFESEKADLANNVEFFDNTKQACKEKSEAFSTRQNFRATELDGVKEAIGILDNDDMKDLMKSSYGKGPNVGSTAEDFLQVDSEAAPVKAAYKALSKAASTGRSLRLAAIAVSVKTSKGHFDKVIKSIDDMVAELKAEGAQDEKDKSSCIQAIHDHTKTIEKERHMIKRNNLKIKQLQNHINALQQQIEETEESKAANRDTVNEMTTTRKTEFATFEQSKADDEQAIKTLIQATHALAKFHDQSAKFDEEGNKNEGYDAVKANVIDAHPDFDDVNGKSPEGAFTHPTLSRAYNKASAGANTKDGETKQAAQSYDHHSYGYGFLQVRQEPEFEQTEGEQLDAMKSDEFTSESANKNQSGAIVKLLNNIIYNMKDEVVTSVNEEKAAHENYEAAMAAGHKTDRTLTQKITDLKAEKVRTEEKRDAEILARGDGVFKKTEEAITLMGEGNTNTVFRNQYPKLESEAELNDAYEGAATGNMNDLALEEEALVATLDSGKGTENAKLHDGHGCDFLVNRGGFDKRKAARDHEVDGLQEAKQLLLGMAPETALLATEQKFDDSKLASLTFNKGFLRR